jgi:ParB-like chromosome segregation protein Spo0J
MFRAPSAAGLPPFSLLLSDLPATPAQVARHLGVSDATMANYRRADQAPRPVMLALFWESRWGRDAADKEAARWAAVQFARARSFEREAARLRAVLDKAPTGAANGPIWA